jgi:hypothetical protein
MSPSKSKTHVAWPAALELFAREHSAPYNNNRNTVRTKQHSYSLPLSKMPYLLRESLAK